jgi:uncharacterized membrane protein YeaQ/YmgE (transglycosylase-associated protein family)
MKIFITLVVVTIAAYLIKLIFKSSLLGKLGNVVVGIVGNLISLEFGSNTKFDWFVLILSSTSWAICILLLFNRFLTKLI